MLSLPVRLFSNLARNSSSAVGRLAASAAVVLVALVAESRAAVVIDIFPDGSNVMATVSGAFNLDVDGRGSQSIGAGSYVTGGGGTAQNSVGFDQVSGNIAAFFWNGTNVGTPPAGSWGSGAQLFSAATLNSLTGVERLWIQWPGADGNRAPTFRIAESYLSNTPISGSWTIANKTMTDLRIDNYGSYVFTFGTTTTDTVTVNLLDANPVPEPSTYAMALAGLACGGYLLRRRRKQA
jgi:hypothetical protein